MCRSFKFLFALFLLNILAKSISSDEYWRSVAFNKCGERKIPFRDDDCNYYTSFSVLVDLIGGGEFTQTFSAVGNQENRVINLAKFPNGANQCFSQPGMTCTQLRDDSITDISIIRSPLPPGVPRVLEGSNTSAAFFWQLTRSEYVPNNGLPMFYGMFKDYNYIDYPYLPEAVGSPDYSDYQFTKQSCSGVPSDAVQLVDITGDKNEGFMEIKEPMCSVKDLGSPVDGNIQFYGTEETNFYSGYTNISSEIIDKCRSPINQFRCKDKEKDYIMDDVDGGCTAICCGDQASIRIRAIGPECYIYAVRPKASIAVDFAIVINNELLGGNVTIPIYGIISPESGAIVIENKGIRVEVSLVKEGFGRAGNLDTFQVSAGEIISCGDWNTFNDTTRQCQKNTWETALEDQIYGPSNNMTWRFLPASLRSIYAEVATRQSAFLELLNGTDSAELAFKSLFASKAKQFGTTPSIIEANIVSYLNSVYQLNDPDKSVDICVGIYNSTRAQDDDLQRDVQSMIFQNIPGYVLDKDPVTGSFINNGATASYPSLCDITASSPSNNSNYFPPSFNETNPNWWIRKGINIVGSKDLSEDLQAYLLFGPSQEVIERLNLEEELKNSLMIKIDINSEYMKYKEEQITPVNFTNVLFDSDFTSQNWIQHTPLINQPSSKILDNCVLPSVDEIQYQVETGNIEKNSPVKGQLSVRVVSLQTDSEINLLTTSGGNIQKPTVSIECEPIKNSGNMGSTPTVDWYPHTPIELMQFEPGLLQTASFDIFVSFEGSSYVDEVLVNTVKLVNCTIHLTPSGISGESNSEIINKNMFCMVGTQQSTSPIVLGNPYSGGMRQNQKFNNFWLYPDEPKRINAIEKLEECDFCDFECRSIASSGCFWIFVTCAIIFVCFIVADITLAVILVKKKYGGK